MTTIIYDDETGNEYRVSMRGVSPVQATTLTGNMVLEVSRLRRLFPVASPLDWVTWSVCQAVVVRYGY